jgi:hypothetical protein
MVCLEPTLPAAIVSCIESHRVAVAGGKDTARIKGSATVRAVHRPGEGTKRRRSHPCEHSSP